MYLLRVVFASLSIGVSCAACHSARFLVDPSQPIAPSPIDGSFRVLHPYLRERVRALELRSPRFREAMERIRSGEVVVYLGTPATLVQLPIRREAVAGQMRRSRIAEFRGIGDLATGTVDTIVVSVDLKRVGELHNTPVALILGDGKLRRRIDHFVESILVHEIWGHVVPVAEAGNASAHCADPAEGENDADSCVMRRENELRRELGWKPRWKYLLRS